MVYTIKKVSELVNLSKASIYNRLKSHELQKHITKKQGVTYLDEIGLKLIQSSLKDFEEVDIKDFKIKPSNGALDDEIATDIDVSIMDNDYRNHLKIENEKLWDELQEKNLQLKDKDLQIHELHKLVENSQVLLKEKPHQDVLQLEEHFQDLDNKLIEIKEKMQNKDQDHRGIFKKIFSK